MVAYVARRLLATIVVLGLVTLIAFSVMHMVPGDPAVVMAGVGASADQVQRIREQFGLDAPFHVRLGRWYGGLLRGDLGNSILLGRTVAQAIAERLPVTLSLAAFAFGLTAVLGLALGTLAAVRQDTWVDQAVMAVSVIGVSVPSFWVGLLLIILFSVMLDWLPAGGYVPLAESPRAWLRALVLPAASLALLQVGLLARITRTTVVETLRQDFVRTARAKGLPGWLVVAKHAFGNVMIPVMTVLGIVVSLLLSGSVVVETVFSIPGLGRLMATAILARDYPVIQGGLLVTALMFVGINLVVDVLYAWLDPRIRYE
jgi:peptide/nickel transport system permease protein